MSGVNGDKSRHNRVKKHRMQLRAKLRALQANAEKPASSEKKKVTKASK